MPARRSAQSGFPRHLALHVRSSDAGGIQAVVITPGWREISINAVYERLRRHRVLRGPALRYLFDLTTSAHWGGADVGILRVERQLARRARQHLGNALEFCIYDRFRNVILTVGDDLAADIIDGRKQIDFTPPATLFARIRLSDVRRQMKGAVLAPAALYGAFRRLRGRSLARPDVQAEASPDDETPTAPGAAPLPLAEVPHRVAALDADTVMISGGLDWDFKDVRGLIALKRQHGFRYCTIVYDLIPILFPHLVVPALIPVFDRYFADLAVLADYAMCISEATRRDWTAFCRARGVDMPASVFPLGSDLPALEGSSSVELPEQLHGKRFALFVSTIEPRKNHRMLYEAWDRCVRSKAVDAERDRLVFVGRHGWAIGDLIRELLANPATRETIALLSHVPDAVLRLLYQQCAFVVLPSLYEGYGLPVAEALAYGKPCISSNAGSLPEIGGDLVVRIDPKDTIRWADAIASHMGSPQQLDAMAARIRAEFRAVTWDQAAVQFFGMIKTIGA